MFVQSIPVIHHSVSEPMSTYVCPESRLILLVPIAAFPALATIFYHLFNASFIYPFYPFVNLNHIASCSPL